MSEEPERAPPHNVEAEQQVLGAILLNNDNLDRISGLQSEHFYEGLHARIFETAQSLVSAGKSASPVTMQTFFEAEEDIGTITVPQYIARLCTACVSTFSVREYANTIRDLATRRELVALGQDMIECASNASPQFTPIDQISEAESRLYALAETGEVTGSIQTISQVTGEVAERARLIAVNDQRMVGITSGLIDLDKKLGGFKRSDLIVVAGRPSMGKTSAAGNFCTSAAEDGKKIAFFSLEMSNDQVVHRMAAGYAEINGEKINNGMATTQELEKYYDALRRLDGLPITIDQTGGLSIAELATRARRMKRMHGLDMIIVDYIQLMRGSGRGYGNNRVQEITEITMGLKAIAKELDIPVIALSQLSRQVESRDDKRPQLSDLRDSGSIEQDADVVIFFYREEYYLERQEPPEGTDKHTEWLARFLQSKGMAEAIVGKQRQGAVGIVKLGFRAEHTKFYNLASGPRFSSEAA